MQQMQVGRAKVETLQEWNIWTKHRGHRVFNVQLSIDAAQASILTMDVSRNVLMRWESTEILFQLPSQPQ